MKIKSYHGLGNHLTIDAHGCSREKLDDMGLIKAILNELPDILNVKKLNEPIVICHEAEEKEESGITGCIIITDSHITIHTYPEKGYFALDIFSCREFDIEKAVSYIKEKLNPVSVETNLLRRGHTEQFNADEKLDEVKGISISKNAAVKELLSQYRNLGFGATHLGKALEVIKNMKKNKATIFLSFTSNMVSSGLRELFAEIVKRKLVHVIITSVGSIEEDIMKTMKPFLLGDFNADDADLHKKGINRIGNIFVPNDRYEMLEDFLMPFFGEMHEKQKKTGRLISPSELIYELGKRITDEKSILCWAAKNNIPIFCPGITDGALGLQLYFYKQNNPDFGIDVTADMKQLADIVLYADKTGGIILGGGIAKHHTIGVNILREGLDYAVYVTTGTQYDGSLSGARTNEAVSWSKIKEEANNACVEGDATIIFPLLAVALLEDD